MRGNREITTTRAVLFFFIGTLVGIVFSPTLKRSGSGERKGFVDEPLRSPAVQRTGFDNAHSNVIHGKARACSCDVSRLSFPLEGVASPYESALRFAAANEAGSDKVSLHSYHLMYGPFLAPYLHKNVVSVDGTPF